MCECKRVLVVKVRNSDAGGKEVPRKEVECKREERKWGNLNTKEKGIREKRTVIEREHTQNCGNEKSRKQERWGRHFHVNFAKLFRPSSTPQLSRNQFLW